MEPGKAENNPRNGQRRHEHGAEEPVTIGQRIDRICEATQMAWKGSRDTVRECKEALDIEGRVDRNPYAMMAAAAGSGYVLGGGLCSPLTARLVGLGLRLGLRVAALPFIQRELGGAEAAGQRGNGSGGTDHQAQNVNVDNQGS